MLKLTRIIPAREETLTVLWLYPRFNMMGPVFREAREASKRKYDKCRVCGHNFIDGEVFGLACFKDEGNDVLCQTCASEFKP